MSRNLIRVVFLEDVHTPRFTMKSGEEWMVRKDKVTGEGFPIGGGFCKSGQYLVIEIRECISCDFYGMSDECNYLGGLGPLCPVCGNTTERANQCKQ